MTITTDNTATDRAYTRAELDEMSAEQQFRLQHALMYRPGLWPEDALTPTGSHTPARFARTSVYDGDAQWADVLAHRDTAGVYRAVGPRRPDAVLPHKVGGKDAVVGLPGLVVDIDTTSGVHTPSPTGPPQPSPEQGLQLLAAYPLCWTWIADTGGGYQAFLALTEPLSGEATAAILARHVQTLTRIHAEAGLALDAGISGNPAALVRVVGGCNRKRRPVVGAGWTKEAVALVREDIWDAPVRLLEADGTRVYSHAELDVALDEIPAREHTASDAAPDASGAYRHACGGTDDPADQVCIELPVSRLMRELPEYTWVAKDSIPDGHLDEVWRLQWSDDEDTTRAASALLYHDDKGRAAGLEVSTIVPRGALTSEALGCTDARLDTHVCSWWLIRNARLGRDGRLTHRLVERFAGDPDGLLAALIEYPDAGSMRTGLPDVATADRPDTQPSLAEAIERMDGTKIVVRQFNGTTLSVIVGDKHHGVWEAVPVWNDESKAWETQHKHLWEGVPFHKSATQYLDGASQAAQPLCVAVILTADGCQTSTPVIPAVDALEPVPVWKISHALVGRPSRSIADQLSTCLQVLSVGATTTKQVALGWLETPAGWTYIGATAGVNAAGSIPGAWAMPPRVSHLGGSVQVSDEPANSVVAATGWPSVPTDGDGIRCAAQVLPALRALTPTRLDVHVVLLGAYLSAPLGLPEQAAINLAGEPGSAKSLLVSCYHALTHNAGVGQKKLTLGLQNRITEHGAGGIRRVHNDAVVVLDDAAANQTRQRNEEITRVVESSIKDAYGIPDGAVGDGGGGARTRRDSRCAVIITSEKALEGLGIVSRALEPPALVKGEVIDGIKSGFGTSWDAPGLLREFYGGYLAWLARLRNAIGADGVRQRAEAAKTGLYALHGADRAADTVGTIAAGWAMVREYAAEYGFEAMLPSQAEITAELTALVGASRVTNTAAGLGAVAMERIAAMLADGSGFVEDSCGKRPSDDVVHACGWRPDTNDEWGKRPQAIHLGWITDEAADGTRLVLISKIGVQNAWRNAGRPESHTQVHAAWALDHTVERYRAVKAPSLGLVVGVKAGFVFTPATLGISPVRAADDARRVVDGSLPAAPPDIVPPTIPTPSPPATTPARAAALADLLAANAADDDDEDEL